MCEGRSVGGRRVCVRRGVCGEGREEMERVHVCVGEGEGITLSAALATFSQTLSLERGEGPGKGALAHVRWTGEHDDYTLTPPSC